MDATYRKRVAALYQEANALRQAAIVRARNQSELVTNYGLQQGHVSGLVLGREKTHLGWSFVGYEEGV